MTFFDALDLILGHKPATEPPVVVNSILDQENAHEQEHELGEHEASLSPKASTSELGKSKLKLPGQQPLLSHCPKNKSVLRQTKLRVSLGSL